MQHPALSVAPSRKCSIKVCTQHTNQPTDLPTEFSLVCLLVCSQSAHFLLGCMHALISTHSPWPCFSSAWRCHQRIHQPTTWHDARPHHAVVNLECYRRNRSPPLELDDALVVSRVSLYALICFSNCQRFTPFSQLASASPPSFHCTK